MESKLNRFRHYLNEHIITIYLVIVIIILVLVNIIKYPSQENFVYSFCDYNFLTNIQGFYLFLGLVTLCSIVFSVVVWRHDIDFQKKTDVNCLIEELKQNRNILHGFCEPTNVDNELIYDNIYTKLENENSDYIYPLRDELIENSNEASQQIISEHVLPEPSSLARMPLNDNYLQSVVNSRNIFTLRQKRIFLNLGHLYFSIKKINLLIDDYNKIPNTPERVSHYINLQNECLNWVYYRLHFMIVDLVMSNKKRDFINKAYAKNVKNKCLGGT